MIPLLDPDLAGPIGAWIGTYLVHSTLLFALAWAGARLVRSVRVREQLWRAALVGPLLTASLQVGAGVDPLGGRWALPRADAPVVEEPLAVADFAPARYVAVSRAPSAEVLAPAPPSEAPAPAPGEQRLRLIATALVALGIASLTLRAFVESLRMRRLGRRWRLDDPALAADLDRLRARAGLRRRIRLERTASGLSPYATGLLRPAIVVPDTARASLDARSTRAMLAHEIGHVVRNDAAWAAVARTLAALFWFQPLNWTTVARLDETAEFACDEFAVRLTGDEVGLARCLTTVAEWLVAARAGATAACPMAHRRSKLSARVERILKASEGRARSGVFARALGIATIATTAFAAPGIDGRGAAPDALSSAAPELATLYAFEFERMPEDELREIFETLAGEADDLRRASEELMALASDRPEVAARLAAFQARADGVRHLASSVAQFIEQRDRMAQSAAAVRPRTSPGIANGDR